MLIACAFGVPTLLCLWVYTLLYVRQNLFLQYLPLVLFSVILGVTVQSLGQSISRRSSGLPARSSDSQTRLLSWSVLLYITLCLGYRALFPGHFSGGLNLLVALLLVATGIMVCARFRPLQAGLTLALLTFVHSLPLLGRLRGHTLSGGPLLLGVVSELVLSTVLALMSSASWTQLALDQSEAAQHTDGIPVAHRSPDQAQQPAKPLQPNRGADVRDEGGSGGSSGQTSKRQTGFRPPHCWRCGG